MILVFYYLIRIVFSARVEEMEDFIRVKRKNTTFLIFLINLYA